MMYFVLWLLVSLMICVFIMFVFWCRMIDSELKKVEQDMANIESFVNKE